MRFFGQMKLRHNLESILEPGLYDKLATIRFIIKIVYNPDIRERLDGCFGGQ